MNVWSVDPGDPFLATLAARLADGTLWPDGRLPDDPLALADVTVYLPTRRAARALAGAFLAAAPGPATVLPRIEALGDAEDDQAARSGVIGLLEARVALAALVRAWAQTLASREPDARIMVPTSGPDAVRLADALLSLMDQVETQEADWADLPGLVARADLAEHWQITTEFLRVATEMWPQHLALAEKLTTAAARRLDAADAIARVANAAGPMVVAGSTGSIPATRRLIRAIADSPSGAVVLPGFDRGADAAAWDALAAAADAPGHPQYGMRQLVDALGVAPKAVRRLAPVAPATVARCRTSLLTAALRPAPDTGRWLADRAGIDVVAALDGIAMVETGDEREEAAAIAVAMRESVALGETVALVTPHRPLARRVTHALRRFGIAVDDSAGEPLAGTPAGVLTRLVAATALGGGAAEWLALFKHPLATFGLAGAARKAGMRAAERMFRGPRIDPQLVLVRLAGLTTREGEPIGGAEALAVAVRDALRPLVALAGATAPVAVLADAHRQALAAVLAAPPAAHWPHAAAQPSLFGDPVGPVDPQRPLFPGVAADEHGRASAVTADMALMDETLADLAACADFTLPAADWPATFDVLIGGIVVRGRPNDAAVRILGPLEARLQAFDHTVLGGLNEGTWPQLPDAGPWMSRGMTSAFGIDLPERRIGLSAHDFVMAAHQPRVTLTRPRKTNGEPMVASRWWQRIAAFAGPDAGLARGRGRRLVALATALDARPAVPPPVRPEPRPPVAVRPVSFSVTEIARLVRDPYLIYAKRILGLKPLDEIEVDPDSGDKGELFHRVLAGFIGGRDHLADDALARFDAHAEQALADLAHAPDARALWGARLRFIAEAVVAHERKRDGRAQTFLVEQEATATLSGGVRLKGRIDRLDIGPGGVDVIDYKTGFAPTAKSVAAFLEPQLPLEAALLRLGGLPDVPADLPVRALTYVHLARGRVPVAWCDVAGDNAGDLAAETLRRLDELLALYADPAYGYLSRARPARENDFSGDYDHFARAAEWANT